jgi:hypothetical protein
MSNEKPLPTTYFALSLVAEIHPGDREAIEEAIVRILCPFGHFEEPGDPVSSQAHPECRMVAQMSTGVDDVETALRWISGVIEVPDSPEALEQT